MATEGVISWKLVLGGNLTGEVGDTDVQPDPQPVPDPTDPGSGGGDPNNPEAPQNNVEPDGGAYQGVLRDEQGRVISCKQKYNIKEDEEIAQLNEFSPTPFGTSPEGLARQAAFEATLDKDSNPVNEGTNRSRAVPEGCKDIPNDVDSGYRLSKYYTIRQLTDGVALGGYALQANQGLSRAEIACNLRHLARNCLDPIVDYFNPLGYRIVVTSGFRAKSGKSNHNIGSAADLQFYYQGSLVTGSNLTRIVKAMDQILKLPYTQIIHEANRVVHVACKRNGVYSSPRLFWSTGFGSPMSGVGYRYSVSLDGSPPVKRG